MITHLAREARNCRCSAPIHVPGVSPDAYEGSCMHRPISREGSPQKPGRGLQFPEARGAPPRCISVCLLQRPFRENQDSVYKAGGFSAHAGLCAGCPPNYCAKGADTSPAGAGNGLGACHHVDRDPGYSARLLRHAGLWPYSAGNSLSCGACSAPRIRDTSARKSSH